MKVIEYGKKYDFNKPVILLGSFETLHIGHEQLITAARKIARENNSDILLFVFRDPVLLPKNSNVSLETLNVRLQRFANNGLNGVIVADFNPVFMNQSGQDFINNLINLYQPRYIVCGEDFRFGKFAQSTTIDLKEFFENTIIVPQHKYKGKKIGTSMIKEMIYYGELDLANSFLKGDWTTSGLIELDFDFIYENKNLILQPGVYVVSIEYEKIAYPALIHINLNKKTTINLLIENSNLEGRKVNVKWHHKLRAIVKDQEDGIIDNDLEKGKTWLSKHF